MNIFLKLSDLCRSRVLKFQCISRNIFNTSRLKQISLFLVCMKRLKRFSVRPHIHPTLGKLNNGKDLECFMVKKITQVLRFHDLHIFTHLFNNYIHFQLFHVYHMHVDIKYDTRFICLILHVYPIKHEYHI